MFQLWVVKDLIQYACVVGHVTLNAVHARKQVCYAIQNVTRAIQNVKTTVRINWGLLQCESDLSFNA